MLLLGDKVDAVVEPGKLGYFTSASYTGCAGLVLLTTATALSSMNSLVVIETTCLTDSSLGRGRTEEEGAVGFGSWGLG